MTHGATAVNRLERFWHELVLTYPDTARINEAAHAPGYVKSLSAPTFRGTGGVD
jgi:hypothetical protein